jgi:hypothetical protein
MAGLIALEAAMMTGARSAMIDGRNVSFNTLNALLRWRTMIRRALNPAPGSSGTLLAAHSNGVNATA